MLGVDGGFDVLGVVLDLWVNVRVCLWAISCGPILLRNLRFMWVWPGPDLRGNQLGNHSGGHSRGRLCSNSDADSGGHLSGHSGSHSDGHS